MAWIGAYTTKDKNDKFEDYWELIWTQMHLDQFTAHMKAWPNVYLWAVAEIKESSEPHYLKQLGGYE